MIIRKYRGKNAFYMLNRREKILLVRKYQERGWNIGKIANKLGVRKKVVGRYWSAKLKLVKGYDSRRLRKLDGNIEIKIYFKLEDYGRYGHSVWINCYRSGVFSREYVEDIANADEIDAWINRQKDIILETNLNWFGQWIYEVEYEWGEEREITNLQEGIKDSKYSYSSDGVYWKEWQEG